MEKTFDYMDELIGKYLAGESTAEECSEVEQWINASLSNKAYFDQLKFIFEKALATKEFQYFDEEAAWNKFKTKLRKEESKTVDFKPNHLLKSNPFQLFFKIAASVIVVLGIGYYLYQTTSVPTKKVASERNTVSDKLPDGSDVYLNKKTSLAYAYDKKKKTHVVKLKGEAYFNIKHDNKKSFLVESDGVYIRDIGTAFNVKAYPEANTIEVVVKEGSIEFFTDSDTGVFLTAGGKGIYNKVTKKFKVDEPETNVLAYKTKFFLFNNQDLLSVVKDLNDVYQKRIVLDNRIEKCRLTVTFNNESIDEIVSVIAETLGLTIVTSGNDIVLQGKGCE